jgi:hypothetical protein
MQAPTHLLTGILIQKAFKRVRPAVVRHFIIALLAFLSHGILDSLVRFTYHPPEPIANAFWISYHLIMFFLTVYIFLKYWRKYKLGLVFSILPDFDWVVLYSSKFLSIQIPFWTKPIFHKISFDFLGSLPQLSFLSSLPNWSLDEKAAILEMVPLLILITYFYINEGRAKEARKLTPPNELSVREKHLNKQFITKWVQKLPVYQAAMDHEQTIRVGYQALLTTLETALFGLWFTLYQLNLTMYPWLLALASITLCIFFGTACEFRARNVDVWRRRIVELVSGTDIEDAFKEGKYRWIPFGGPGYWGNYVFGHWYERILIPIMLAVWLSLLWYLASPVYLISLVASWLWILYTFNLVELKAEYYDYDTH